MRLIVFAIVVLMQALAAGCIFDTREDEVRPPDSGGNTIRLDDPLQVFVAIRETLNESRQDANYERAISSQFIFSPTLQDSLDQNFAGTGVYDNWVKTREMSVLALMLAEAQSIRAEFSPQVEIDRNTFQRYKVSYELDLINTAQPTDTLRYRGVAFFDVRLESGNWRLTYWDEIETVAGFPTWGFLRGVLGLQATP